MKGSLLYDFFLFPNSKYPEAVFSTSLFLKKICLPLGLSKLSYFLKFVLRKAFEGPLCKF